MGNAVRPPPGMQQLGSVCMKEELFASKKFLRSLTPHEHNNFLERGRAETGGREREKGDREREREREANVISGSRRK
jgi:hypothetical protein